MTSKEYVQVKFKFVPSNQRDNCKHKSVNNAHDLLEEIDTVQLER